MDLETIRAVASAARAEHPSAGTRSFSALLRAELHAPVLVRAPAGAPAYWLVPLVIDDAVCGFVHVDLQGKAARVGTYGAGPDDAASWIPVAFFCTPPATMLAEVAKRFDDLTVAEPMLSYDRSPNRLAWRVEVREGKTLKSVAFLSPGGWYETSPDR